MKVPWARTAPENDKREARYEAARLHLRVVLNELQQTLSRIEDKRREMPGA